MSLFEGDEYQTKKARKPRTRHVERAVKLAPPWVLLRHHAQPPMAHLPIPRTWDVESTLRGLERSGVEMAMPRCLPKKAFMVLEMDGHPLAPVCPHCLEYATKNGMKVTVIERG